jgi:putative hydrolase of the HAD superfamily
MDLDDTILAYDVVAKQVWLEVCTEFADQLGEITPQQLVAAIEEYRRWYWADPERHRKARLNLAPVRRDVVDGAFRRLGVEPPDVAEEIGNAYAIKREQAVKPFPGAMETLQRLKEAGVRMALVTNGTALAQRRKIDRFCLDGYFQHILIEGEFGVGKPNPSVYRHALGQIGAAASEAWMVGDNLEWEVAAPQRLGITGVWHDWRGRGVPTGSTVRPDRIIRSLPELLQLPLS